MLMGAGTRPSIQEAPKKLKDHFATGTWAAAALAKSLSPASCSVATGLQHLAHFAALVAAAGQAHGQLLDLFFNQPSVLK